MENLIEALKNIGLSTKASKVYLASLQLGEATILDLAKKSKIKRTTIYHVLLELLEIGALIETRVNKKKYYVPDEPKNLIRRSRDRVLKSEDYLEEFDKIKKLDL